jgi:hypothetical protein
VISLIGFAVIAQVSGAVLNRIVIARNEGMPSIACTAPLGKWVSIGESTKYHALSDIFKIGNYALSLGDLLIIAGLTASLAALWLAIPKARKFFIFLVASLVGIFLSIAEPDKMIITVSCEITALVTVLAMYWAYRSEKRITVKVSQPDLIKS